MNYFSGTYNKTTLEESKGEFLKETPGAIAWTTSVDWATLKENVI